MVDKELIENWRNMLKPAISSRLLKTNYEGMGEQDKEEFERDFDEFLDLALTGLKYKAQLLQERTKSHAETHACDLIDREAAVDAIYHHLPSVSRTRARTMLHEVPSAQPEVIRCKDCIYYDPPHVKNNGMRYEYGEMPADAFDALGTGLVSAEYGINIGGRCCVDYYCKNYSDDKRVFVREDNYCGRAERRIDD